LNDHAVFIDPSIPDDDFEDSIYTQYAASVVQPISRSNFKENTILSNTDDPNKFSVRFKTNLSGTVNAKPLVFSYKPIAYEDVVDSYTDRSAPGPLSGFGIY